MTAGSLSPPPTCSRAICLRTSLTLTAEHGRNRIQTLADLGKDEDADGIKSWLRSQYAENIRERRRGAVAQDFELIGTEFHRWVRANEKASVSRRAANSPGSSSATSLFMAAGMNACGVPLRPRSRDSNVSTSML